MYQTEAEATEIVKRVRESIKDLTMAASLAVPSGTLQTIANEVHAYVSGEESRQESRQESADETLIELLTCVKKRPERIGFKTERTGESNGV